MRTVAQSMALLRNDALALGMKDLSVAYGWSVIRFGAEEIERRAARLEAYRGAKTGIVSGK